MLFVIAGRLSLITAQIKAPTQPNAVHPANRFNKNIGKGLFLCLATAIIVGKNKTLFQILSPG